VVPRAHSIHGPSPSGLANRSVDNLPHTSTIDALHSESHIKDSIISAQQEQRMIKSEHGSPHLLPTTDANQLNGQMPPLDLSRLEDFSTDYSYVSYECFTPLNDDQPIFSAGLSSASVDWSLYDGLDFNNDNFAAPSYSQAQSFTGFDFGSTDQPALTTTSTSGEISEVEDFGPIADSGATCPVVHDKQYGSDTSDFGEHDGYRLSTTSSFIGLPQVQLIGNSNMASNVEEFLKDVDPNDFISNHGLTANDYSQDSKYLQDNVTFPLADDGEALWMNDFTMNNSTTANNTNVATDICDDNPWIQ